MTDSRNLDICLGESIQIMDVTGSQRFHEALGYLSSWNMTYGYVRITGGIYSGNPELIATYKDEANGPVRYQIGAVWHDDHFGFHS